MKNIYLFLIKNWKTSVSGIIVAILVYLQQIGVITESQFTLYTSVMVAIGFLFSKDGDETGTFKSNSISSLEEDAVHPPKDGTGK